MPPALVGLLWRSRGRTDEPDREIQDPSSHAIVSGTLRRPPLLVCATKNPRLRLELTKSMKVEIKQTRLEFSGFAKVERPLFPFERFGGGMTEEMTRHRYFRGDAVGVLVYD